MNTAKKKYQKQCKIKTVTFYKKDEEILQFANTINFQKFVKEALYVAYSYTVELHKYNKWDKQVTEKDYITKEYIKGLSNGNIQDN